MGMRDNRLCIEPIDFDDPAWDDPEIRGWLLVFMLYCVGCVMFIITAVYRLEYVSTDLKLLMATPSLLGIYAIMSICLRWRNAFFLANSFVGLAMFFHLIVFIGTFYIGASAVYKLVCGGMVAIDIVWQVYLCKSRLMEVRFPKKQMKVFWWDIVFDVVVFVMTIWIIVFVTPLVAPSNSRQAKETRKEISTINRGLPQIYGKYVIVEVACDGEYLSVGTTLDHELYGTGLNEEIHEMWENLEDVNRFIEDMYVCRPDLFDYAESNGFPMRWVMFYDDPSRGEVYELSLKDVISLRRKMAAKDKERIDAHKRLEDMVSKLSYDNEKTPDPAIRLDRIVAEANHLVYCYEIDESKASFVKVEDAILDWNASHVFAVIDNGIRQDSLLQAALQAGVDVVYRYRCSRSGFAKEYVILSQEELEDADKAIANR